MPSLAKKHRIKIPKFASRQLEAEWFDRNRRRLEADMSRRLQIGDVKTLADALGQTKLKPITIQMLSGDLELARRLAIEKGLTSQTFIKTLLRDALHRESRKSGSAR